MTKKKTTNASADYQVGRGKPPRSSQFKPGQSGNPGGRKKGGLNLKTIMKAVLESEIELTENGRRRRVPLIEAIILRQAQEALRGQPRAIDSLLDRYERHAGDEVEQPEELPEDDLALLQRVIGSSGRRRRSQQNPAADSLSDKAVEEDSSND
jgi:hypothetical protein